MTSLPDFLIIGSMKSGTSSLHDYLDLHPDISMSNPKELDYFIVEKNYHKGLDWYKNHFVSDEICGESSPNYTKASTFKGVPNRIFDILPDVKLIYVMREPVDRMISHYKHQYYDHKEDRSIDDALTITGNHYLDCSDYIRQIECYLEYFHIDQFHFLTAESLRVNPDLELKRIFDFLGVKNFSIPSKMESHNSEKKYRLSKLGRKLSKSKIGFKLVHQFKALFTVKQNNFLLKPETFDQLKSIIYKDFDQLKEITGLTFSEWAKR